ncbi:MAG: TetR family transcriptional regulator [Hyphomicrobiales bacterium]|nr:TetR family transcriptional regulator [Hyphomicrobiales bacterium]
MSAKGPWGGPPGEEPAPRRSYHHGGLKDALIEAARALIERSGPGGFSLTEAARIVGVTPAAPYRHFSDRDALMGEVAKRGFDLFTARLAGAWEGGRPDADTALARMGRAYLDFARTEPGYYRSMFTNAPEPGSCPDPAAGRAFATIELAAAATLRARGRTDLGGRSLALEIWALSHGVATLMLGGYLPAGPDSDPAALLQRAAGALVEAAVRSAGPR